MKKKYRILKKSLKMSKKSPSPAFAWDYFQKLFSQKKIPANAYHILSTQEQRAIRTIEFTALCLSASLGALGVIMLYLPLYFFPQYFWNLSITLPWGGLWDFPLAFTLYGLVLAVAEIVALLFLNLRTVFRISQVCGYPNPTDVDYEKHLNELFEVSFDKQNTNILAYGLNPLEGLSKNQILAFTAFNMLKATLSNWLLKFILTRVLARLTVVRYVDLIGIPVFAAWDAYATYRVMREAKVRIMAMNVIRNLAQQLHHKFKDRTDFKEILLESLQLIAMAKRTFHHNHYWLADYIIRTFGLSIQRQSPLKLEDILEKIRPLDFEERQGLAKLFILGMIIDGKLSRRERKVLEEFTQAGMLQFDKKKLREWAHSFLSGKGLSDLFSAKVVASNQA